MTREDAKTILRDKEPDFLERAKQNVNERPTWVCPACGNGKGSDGTGIAYNPKAKGDLPHYKCFKCGLHADVIELYKLRFNVSDDKEAFDGIYRHYGVIIDTANTEQAQSRQSAPQSRPTTPGSINIAPPQNAPQNAPQPPIQATADYTAYYERCTQNLLQSPAAISYLEARGISTTTAARYNIGFDADWQSPKALANGKPTPKTPRIILPTSPAHYVARDIRADAPPKFAKMNEGSAGIFNAAALTAVNPPKAVFIVEGIFDALSVIEAGGAAIATNSTQNIDKLLQITASPDIRTAFVICMDNDEAGQAAEKKLVERLKEQGKHFVTADICCGCKDANEALQKNKALFKREISEALQCALYPDGISTYIDIFMQSDIVRYKEGATRKTGFANIDEQITGLYSGLYCIAAIPSLGKTTLAHQIADNLAEAGEEVLFFSLEMSRLEMASKSISRMTARNDIATAVSSLAIRSGFLPENVIKAVKDYKSKVENRLNIIEGSFTWTCDTITQYIETHIERTGKKPVVFIDYLQIVQPNKNNQSTRDALDVILKGLKVLSRKYGLVIFIISSVNRANYMTPIAFESLKETGAIEYTCDAVWGLQLQCLHDEIFSSKGTIKEMREKIDNAKAESPRKIELKGLKNRNGVNTWSAYFDYIPKFDYFTEGTEQPKTGEEEATQRRAGRKRL